MPKSFKLNEQGVIHLIPVIALAAIFISLSLFTIKKFNDPSNSGEVAGIFDFLRSRDGSKREVREGRGGGNNRGNTGSGEGQGDNNGGGTNGNQGIQPYADAPNCPEIGILHDPRKYHGLWDYEKGCHWDHEHKMNPHDLDDVFGTDVYTWAGGELSYPWQTYSGAGANFEAYTSSACYENDCKHQGYKWFYFRDRTSQENIEGALLLGSHVITDSRVQIHAVGGQMGALTRFHSVWLEARACYQGNISDETCGIYKGGGWLDLGRLNYPNRGTYAPLPGDPEAFADTKPEAAPYRIHPTGQNSLDSWQSEGNEYNYLPTDPTGSKRLRVGYGVHFLQGESPSETDPSKYGHAVHDQDFWCLNEEGVFTCNNNNSAAAYFRSWVSIPKSLDGSSYDEDGQENGYFTFHGHTNRYGDIVEGCTSVSLDCIPAVAENFPIGGCSHPSGICKSAYRGGVDQDAFEADVSPAGVNWIKYPN